MTNDITILSCPQCGFPRIRDVGNGLYQCDDCGTHFDKDENVVLTNEEWFCNLSTEEKAEFFVKIEMSAMHPVKRGAVDMEKFIEEVAEWLKQPHIKE